MVTRQYHAPSRARCNAVQLANARLHKLNVLEPTLVADWIVNGPFGVDDAVCIVEGIDGSPLILDIFPCEASANNQAFAYFRSLYNVCNAPANSLQIFKAKFGLEHVSTVKAISPDPVLTSGSIDVASYTNASATPFSTKPLSVDGYIDMDASPEGVYGIVAGAWGGYFGDYCEIHIAAGK
jgi:hypothetical protein